MSDFSDRPFDFDNELDGTSYSAGIWLFENENPYISDGYRMGFADWQTTLTTVDQYRKPGFDISITSDVIQIVNVGHPRARVTFTRISEGV